MSEEIKMVPPGDLANADAATPKSAATGPTLYCSFCGKSQYEVVYLIAGPVALICDECTDVCVQVISEARAASSAEQTEASGPGMNPDQFKATHP